MKESTSNHLIKQPTNDQSTSLLTSTTTATSKDETKITESSLSGPSTSSIQTYDKPSFKPSMATSSLTSSSSNNYKHYSSINTTKSSPVTKEEDIQVFKPLSYSMTSTTNLSGTATSTAAATTSSSNTIATKTVSVKTNGSKMATTVTNNFKLPPFPVYIPSTSMPSSIHLSTESGLNSKSETSTAAFSSKYSDSPASSSVTTAYSTTLSRLSSSSSSPSRTITNVNTTNTLPLHLGRNNPYLYQSESNFNRNPTTASYSSPVASYTSSQSNYNNSYSTLPKTTGSSTYGSSSSKYDNDNDKLSTSYSSSYKYSTDYYSNIASTTNNTTTNGTSTSSASDNNVYRVQYSATNPFLDPVDTSPLIATTSSGSDNISSLLRGSVAETKKRFEKLDSEEDLK